MNRKDFLEKVVDNIRENCMLDFEDTNELIDLLDAPPATWITQSDLDWLVEEDLFPIAAMGCELYGEENLFEKWEIQIKHYLMPKVFPESFIKVVSF